MILARSLLAVLVVGLVACSLPGGRPGEPPSYFPMEADRIWDYRLHELPRNRIWPVAVRSRGPRFVPELGRVVAIFEEEYPDQVLPIAFFLSEGFLHGEIGLGFGIENRMTVFPIGTQPMRVMPMPPKIGMQWSYSESVFAVDEESPPPFVIRWKGEIQGEESVIVPAGRFERCLRVLSIASHEMGQTPQSQRDYRYVDWYAPDIGLVKSEFSSGPESPALMRMELVRFSRQDPRAPRDRTETLVLAGGQGTLRPKRNDREESEDSKRLLSVVALRVERPL